MNGLSRDKAIDILTQLEHSLFHLKQAGDDIELRSGRTGVAQAERKLRESLLVDVVFASTVAEPDESCPGNVVVGVTAHCRCGHTFCDDVRAGCLIRHC